MAEKKEKQYVSNNAQLMAEWNWERNADIVPSQLTLGSGKKVWWKCGKGHEWEVACYSRIAGNQCPAFPVWRVPAQNCNYRRSKRKALMGHCMSRKNTECLFADRRMIYASCGAIRHTLQLSCVQGLL